MPLTSIPKRGRPKKSKATNLTRKTTIQKLMDSESSSHNYNEQHRLQTDASSSISTEAQAVKEHAQVNTIVNDSNLETSRIDRVRPEGSRWRTNNRMLENMVPVSVIDNNNEVEEPKVASSTLLLSLCTCR